MQKDESHCAVEGLWRPQAIPLVVVRYGEVGIHQVIHQDLLIRPKVVCAWWHYKCSSLPEWYSGAPKCFATGDNLEDLQVASKWRGVLAAASEGWAASRDGEVVVNIAAALASAQLPATVTPKYQGSRMKIGLGTGRNQNVFYVKPLITTANRKHCRSYK